MKSVLMVLFLIIPIALLTGLVASQGVKFSVLWFAALGGLGLLAISNAALVWCITILALVIVGQTIYFARIDQAVWIPYGVGMLMFMKMPMVYANSPFSKLSTSPPLVFPVLILIGSILLSALINTIEPLRFVISSKSYIFLWGVFLLIAYWGVSLQVLNKIWSFCIWIVFFQLPLVLYQCFVVAPTRSNLGGKYGVSWDAIVGGFGGDPMGGGASGTMAWFLVFVTTLSISMFRHKLMKASLLISIGLVSLICIGLAEVKVVVLLFPLGIGALLLPYLKKNPFVTIVGFIVSLLIGFLVLVIYGSQNSSASGDLNWDVLDVLNDAFWYSLDPDYINFVTGEMGRVASISHWWQENGLGDLLHTLFGHGPGSSSNSATFGLGEVARKYPFDINRSTLSIFLWDIGLVGVFIYLLIIVRASLLALKTSKIKNLDPFQAATLEAIFGGLIMIIIMLPYGKDVSEVPALGVLLMFFLGYVSLSSSELLINAKLKK